MNNEHLLFNAFTITHKNKIASCYEVISKVIIKNSHRWPIIFQKTGIPTSLNRGVSIFEKVILSDFVFEQNCYPKSNKNCSLFRGSGGLLSTDKGAYLNGLRLQVSTCDTLVESIVGTGFFCLRAGWKEENNLKYISRIAPLVCDLRKYGSAALDACLVARGSLDAWWELCLAPYDIAAGVLILTEAGGKITDLHGGSEYPHKGIMGSNGAIHSTLLNFFEDHKDLHYWFINLALLP